jgi:eukaryotic-like serine/threonine-protein kinase
VTDVVTDTPPHAPGSLLAPGLEVIGHLRRGRTLDVYDVWSRQRMCRCVAKTLIQDRTAEQQARRGLIQEGRLLRRLTHPHIVRCYEVVESCSPVRPVVVLETLSGATLAYLIDERDRLSIGECAVLGLQLSSALAYMHLNAYLHLDLKPSNIVADSSKAKLIDLSIAHPRGKRRAIMGTRDYMAPEQINGEELTEATDVWGLGLVLYEAATGALPFESGGDDLADTSDEDFYPQLDRTFVSVREHRRLPPLLAECIDKCLQQEPALRPSLEELFDRLTRVAAIDPKTIGAVYQSAATETNR